MRAKNGEIECDNCGEWGYKRKLTLDGYLCEECEDAFEKEREHQLGKKIKDG